MCVPVSEIVNELGDFRVKVGHGLVHLVFFEKGDAGSLPVMSLWICLRGGVVVYLFREGHLVDCHSVLLEDRGRLLHG